MTDTVASTPAPKKSKKNLFILIAFILTILGIDNYHTHFFFGTDITVTDSTIVVTPTIDSVSNAVDTTKKDAVK